MPLEVGNVGIVPVELHNSSLVHTDIHIKTQEMYNLTVATAHTYYVGDGQWLVHNADCDKLYRSMSSADDGLPQVGSSARTLGARPGIDIPIDESGMVHPNTGGMSVTPNDPKLLPPHRRPPELGGTGKDPVFCASCNSLPDGLQYRPDPANPSGHGFIEPSRPMAFDQYQKLIESWRGNWKP